MHGAGRVNMESQPLDLTMMTCHYLSHKFNLGWCLLLVLISKFSNPSLTAV